MVEDGRQEQRQHQREAEPADDHCADGGAAFRTGAGGDDQRHRAQNGREHRHDDRPKTQHRGIDDGLAHAQARVAHLVGELDDEDAVLCHQADQQDDADLAVDVERQTGQRHRVDCAGDGERHRQHDHQRVDEAFELRGEHEEDDQQRQCEGDGDIARSVLVNRRLSGIAEPRALGEDARCAFFHVRNGVAERVVGVEPGGDGDRGQPIVAAQLRRGGALRGGDERAQRHQGGAVSAAQEDIVDVGRRTPVLAARLHDHRVFAAAIDIGGNFARGEQRLQGRRDGLRRDAEIVSACAFEPEVELRLVLLVVDAGIDQPLVGLGMLEQRGRPLLDLLEIGSTDDDAQRRRVAAQAESTRTGDARARAGETTRGRSYGVDHLGLTGVALVPRGQP